MFSQTDKGWRVYRALNQNWSYQPTFCFRIILNIMPGPVTHNLTFSLKILKHLHEIHVNYADNVIFFTPYVLSFYLVK